VAPVGMFAAAITLVAPPAATGRNPLPRARRRVAAGSGDPAAV